MAAIDMSEEAAGRMRAMVLRALRTQLVQEERSQPMPGPGEIRLRVEACAVCRTDLHVIDGDLRHPKLPLIPGHEIVGIIDSVGKGVARSRIGRRVGVPWLGHTCGHCPYCLAENENLWISQISLAIHAMAASPVMSLPMRNSPSIWTRMPRPYHWRRCFALA